MFWTKEKPSQPGYYFYRSENTPDDVVPVDYILDWGGLYYWEEWCKEWIRMDDAPEDVEWSDKAIPFPKESK